MQPIRHGWGPFLVALLRYSPQHGQCCASCITEKDSLHVSTHESVALRSANHSAKQPFPSSPIASYLHPRSSNSPHEQALLTGGGNPMTPPFFPSRIMFPCDPSSPFSPLRLVVRGKNSLRIETGKCSTSFDLAISRSSSETLAKVPRSASPVDPGRRHNSRISLRI